MAEERKGPDPIEQLIDLFVYAPIGLLYEYDEVRERLVKRGKSQVQLARVVGQLAVSGRRAAGDPNDVAETAAATVAKVATEIGTLLGLLPDQRSSSVDDARTDDERSEAETTTVDVDPTLPDASAATVPIAGYDDLKAKEIILLLDELSADERSAVRAHELAGRARKTVLAKLDRLDQ